MTRFEIFDAIARLRAEGRPFSVATVVRTADATSAKAGAKAAVTAEGEIIGHLGGACLARAVRLAAAEALAAGEPRLIRVKPAGDAAAAAAGDDVAVYDSGCPSRGTAEILIEPYRLPPLVVVVGTTPIAEAVAAHARLAGYRVAAVEGDAAGPEPGPQDVVVIASQGRGDAAALRSALLGGAGRVTMIASRRKAAALRERLVAEGVPEAAFGRLKAPGGLDLGGIDPHEIAVSVLAEIILWQNRERRARADATAPRG